MEKILASGPVIGKHLCNKTMSDVDIQDVLNGEAVTWMEMVSDD